MSQIAVMLGLPAYGGQVTTVFMESLLRLIDLARSKGIGITLKILSQESLIPRGRNTIVAEFLGRAELTHLLFIDADIGFDPQGILRMLAFDKPVIGGAYAKKGIDWPRVQAAALAGKPASALAEAGLDYALNLIDEDLGSNGSVPVKQGFVRVAKCGTGILLIQRETLLRMTRQFPALQYENDIAGYDNEFTRGNFWGFFDTLHHPVTRRYLSEDYAFCHRWTQGCGGEIWMDVESVVTHHGSYGYRGSFLSVVAFTPD
ncbi:MAG: hypothetical protein V4650_13060 [Pseudomonadota bacterium]